MLTSIEIENFKGFGARQCVDFAPLTLLFGANSAGKSTILQALLYLHEIIERGSADVDCTELGGSALGLGGFGRLVHQHDTERPIVLRAEFATNYSSLERFGRDLSDFPFPDLDDDVDLAWLELTVRWRTTAAFRGALVERAVIGVNGKEPLVWLEVGASLRDGEPLYARVNLGHPLLRDVGMTVGEAWAEAAIPEDTLCQLAQAAGDGFGDGYGFPDLAGEGFGDGRGLPVFAVSRSRLSALPSPHEPLRVIPFGDDSPDKSATAAQVRTFLEMVILGTTAQLSAALSATFYIGPLRAVPPRGFLYERRGRNTNWADGLAAWDLLLSDRGDLVDGTNRWLQRLGADCKVVVQQLFDRSSDAEDISAEHVDKTARRLLLATGSGAFVLPSEVGAGVSQLVPVVVAALTRHSGLTAIEQPELHVHPAMQVGLGDLFVEAVVRAGQFVLVETHSEHLILRLLRRIRETTAGELPEGADRFEHEWLSVVYVQNRADGATVQQLRLDENGEFLDRWPSGFFEERARELF